MSKPEPEYTVETIKLYASQVTKHPKLHYREDDHPELNGLNNPKEMLNPIDVVKSDKPDIYWLIAGYQRWKTLVKLEFQELLDWRLIIPKNGGIKLLEKIQRRENYQRSDRTPWEVYADLSYVLNIPEMFEKLRGMIKEKDVIENIKYDLDSKYQNKTIRNETLNAINVNIHNYSTDNVILTLIHFLSDDMNTEEKLAKEFGFRDHSSISKYFDLLKAKLKVKTLNEIDDFEKHEYQFNSGQLSFNDFRDWCLGKYPINPEYQKKSKEALEKMKSGEMKKEEDDESVSPGEIVKSLDKIDEPKSTKICCCHGEMKHGEYLFSGWKCTKCGKKEIDSKGEL